MALSTCPMSKRKQSLRGGRIGVWKTGHMGTYQRPPRCDTHLLLRGPKSDVRGAECLVHMGEYLRCEVAVLATVPAAHTLALIERGLQHDHLVAEVGPRLHLKLVPCSKRTVYNGQGFREGFCLSTNFPCEVRWRWIVHRRLLTEDSLSSCVNRSHNKECITHKSMHAFSTAAIAAASTS